MIAVSQIQVNIARAYIAYTKECFPLPTYESKKFLLILEIYEWQLKRLQTQRAATFSELKTLKHGVREAEWFLNEVIGDDRQDVGAEIAELLWAIVMELTKAIIANEELYPDLKTWFDNERAEYRVMLAAVQEAERS